MSFGVIFNDFIYFHGFMVLVIENWSLIKQVLHCLRHDGVLFRVVFVLVHVGRRRLSIVRAVGVATVAVGKLLDMDECIGKVPVRVVHVTDFVNEAVVAAGMTLLHHLHRIKRSARRPGQRIFVDILFGPADRLVGLVQKGEFVLRNWR